MLKYDIYALSDDMVDKEGLSEVTSSKIFVREGEPDPEGLASYEIFGYPGTEERRKHFAYIKLNDIFVHPHVLFELKSIKSAYVDLVYGNAQFYLKDGDIQRLADNEEAPKGAVVGTGTRFLKSIWNKLTFDYGESTYGVRFNRLRFLKSISIDDVFMDKMIVIPPFYRDVDMSGNKKNEINNIYIKIINLADTLKSTSIMMGVFNDVSDTYKQIQQTIVEFHEYVIKWQGGRKGFIHQYMMGKGIDYAARLVISCVDVSKADTVDDMDVSFDKSAFPLFATIKCFAPFIVNGVREIIKDYLHGSEYIIRSIKSNSAVKIGEAEFANSRNTYERVRLAADWESVLTSSYIYNLIELYHDSPEHRLDKFTLPTDDGGKIPVSFYMWDEEESDIDIASDLAQAKTKTQQLRLIHLFYMAAYDKVRDKHVYVTRYPIEDHNNTYPSGINIIPYSRTGTVKVGDSVYPRFPLLDLEKDMPVINTMFTDSLTIFPGYLSALNGDFDGDMLSAIGIFSDEANEDAKNYIYSIGNMTAINGGTTRSFGTLATHIINALTYWEE